MRTTMNEDGSTLVEMAVSFSVFVAVLLGVMQMSMALYSYHFVSDAAREASRWAMVRGSACASSISTSFCSPTSSATTGATNADIQTYVNSLGYPFSGSLTTSTTWCVASSSTPTTWTSCGTTSAYKTAGSQVQVTVSYSFPIAIPFWKNTTIPVSSTSSMVLSE